MQPAATTLRGALLVLCRNDPAWLDEVDRQLGNVLTGTDLSKSMHGILGWLAPGSDVPQLVREALLHSVEGLSSVRRGRVRLELVSAIHTTILARTFFHQIRTALAEVFELPVDAAPNWHQEEHSFVSYLYSDDLPVLDSTRALDAHFEDVRSWVADRAERVRRALHQLHPHPGIGVLSDVGFIDTTTSTYSTSFATFAQDVPEFAMWLDNDFERRPPNRGRPPERLSRANQTVVSQPLEGDPHLPALDQLYISPAFRTAEASPSARLTDDRWWSEIPVRHNFELTLARHLSNPQTTRVPLLVIGDAAAGKSSLTKMLATFPPMGDEAVVRVPLRSANPSLPVADQVEEALRHLTGGEVTWDDLADLVCVVVLDGLDELSSPRAHPDYLSEVIRFQRNEAARGRTVAVVVTSRTSGLDHVLIPDRVPVVRLEPFDDAQIRAWIERWNRVTARTPLRAGFVLAHESLARQPGLLFMMARYFTDPSVPEPPDDISTTAVQERLLELRAQQVGVEPRLLAVAALGMFNRSRQWISRAEFQADVRALGLQVPQVNDPQLRSGPLFDHEIASYLLEVLTEPDDELLFSLLSHADLGTRPSILTTMAELARPVTTQVLTTLARNYHRPRTGGHPAYRPTPRSEWIFTANLHLLRAHITTGSSEGARAEPRSGIEFVHRGLKAGTEMVGQVTWSSDGQLLSANSGRRIKYWTITDSSAPRERGAHPDVTDIAWHPTRPMAALVQRESVSRIALVGFGGGETTELHTARRGTRISWSPSGLELALFDSFGLRIIEVATGRTLREHQFGEAGTYVPRPVWTHDGQHVLVAHRRNVRLFRSSDLAPVWRRSSSGRALEFFVPDQKHAIGVFAGEKHALVLIHDLVADMPVALLEEHKDPVLSAKFSPDGSFLATLSEDNTAKIWRCRDWQCVATVERKRVERRGGLAFHPTKPLLAVKDGNKVDIVRLDYEVLERTAPAKAARRYVNAKVVLVGDTGVGKSGLGLVLSGKPFAPTESTHGRTVWTFEKTYATLPSSDVQTRETLLWDLAGQPGYRMVHQLHLNEVAVALVVFDARSETDPFAGVQYWSRALAQARRLDGTNAVRMRVYLVAARADRGTAAVSQERIQETLKAFGFDGYVETSAKEGWGLDDLVRSIRDGIDWDALPVVSSNELFEAIKDFVVEEKQQGRILSTVDDLVRSFRRTQQDPPSVEELSGGFTACIGRLESVGVVRRMSYGDYVLLRPELLDSYASSLVQAAKDEPDGLGFVTENDALEGRFRIPGDEKLTHPQQERILLNAVVQELLRREIALKEVTDREVDLIFPSQFTRERPDAPQLPGQDVVFTFDGHLYSIYSTLAVRLAHSRFFEKDEMWHNSATYKADAGRCGITIREIEEGKGELALCYDEQVVPLVRKQFEAYVVEHLEQRAGEVTMRRVRRCGLCGYTIPDDLVRGRRARGKTKMICPQCDDFVITLVDGPDEMGDVRPVVAEMNSYANAQRDEDVAATTLRGKREAGDYDVFLCHNVRDKPRVLRIVAELHRRGILPWLDVHDIQPGSRWQQEMAKGIERSRSAAVLIGSAGPGPWHEAEMELINDWSARNKSRRVIPVILDGTEGDPELPGFLRVWSTVDMRTADPDPIEQLIWGITGRHPRWD
jgi:GTPase SAR1 family protein